MYDITKIKTGLLFPTLPTAYGNSLSYYEELQNIANKVNEIIDVFNSGFEDIINQNIDKYFNNIMIDAMYDGSRETLVLKKETSSTGDIHVYRENTKTIEVM